MVIAIISVLGIVSSAIFPLLQRIFSDRVNGIFRPGAKLSQQMADKRQQLTQTHPELATMLTILEYNDQMSGGRSFWGSFLQNLFFFTLGVVVPVILNYFHLF